jgi:hypothetical protein
MGEALFKQFSPTSPVRSSGDPLIELLTFFFSDLPARAKALGRKEEKRREAQIAEGHDCKGKERGVSPQT